MCCAVNWLKEVKVRSKLISFAVLMRCRGFRKKRVAVIGEGALGASSALALIERDPSLNITVFHDVPFEKTVSWGPAGLFRVDTLQNRLPSAHRVFDPQISVFLI